MTLLTRLVLVATLPSAAWPATATRFSQASQPGIALSADRATYKLGPTDQLKIDVIGEDELKGTFPVDDAGFISYPYLNRIAVQGMTAREVEDKLRTLLQAGYLRNPQVRVEIDQYRSQKVIMMGEVKSPGTLTLSAPAVSLLEALGQAGSTTAAASSIVTVTRPRRGDRESQSFRVDLHDLEEAGRLILQDGDVVKVPKAETFYITGQVRNSGTFIIDSNLTLEQAVTLAGGLTERGTYGRAKVTRVVNGKSLEVKLGKGDLVKPGDVITIAARIL